MRRLALGLAYMALAAPAADGFSLMAVARTTVGINVARDSRFDAGAQFSWSTGALVEGLTSLGLGCGVSLEYGSTYPSPVVDLVSYRGYAGGRLSGFAAWWGDLGPMRIGVRAGVQGQYVSYTSTEIYFVFPGAVIEPAVAFRIADPEARSPGWGVVGVSLPLTIARRPDLVLSAQIALAVEVGVFIGRGRVRA